MESHIWIEKYRPQTFADIKGHDKIVERIKAMVRLKILNHLLLAGPAGVGKTSVIFVAARELYGENWRPNVLETNASMDRGINIIREEIRDFARIMPMGDFRFKLCVMDEADALTKEAQQALRRTMEQYSRTCRFCLIANYSSRIIDPIQSRCVIFRFRPLDNNAMKAIIDNIIKKEGLSVDSNTVDVLCELGSGDVRRVENIMQSCAIISKKITEKLIFEVVSYAQPKEIKFILETALRKEFNTARNKLLDVMLHYGLSGLDIIKQIQKEIWNLDISEEQKVKLVDKCGEIEFRMVEGADEYIQLEALLANFLI